MTTVAGLVGALLIALVVLRLVLHRRLLVKYATLWLFVSALLVLMTAIPTSLTTVSDLVGFEVPANFLFLSGFVLLLVIAVQLSVELTSVERRVQRLAEEVALLDARTKPEVTDSEG